MTNEECFSTKSRTRDVVNDLVCANEGLVWDVLHKYKLSKNHDAVSLAFEALFIAVLEYDITKNAKFSTFATIVIYNRIGSYIRTTHNKANSMPIISYHSVITDNEGTLLDFISSTETADNHALDLCFIDGLNRGICAILKETHNYNHKEVIKTWITSDFKMPQATIAERVGCSQSYVTQILNKFKTRLKIKLKEYDLWNK